MLGEIEVKKRPFKLAMASSKLKTEIGISS